MESFDLLYIKAVRTEETYRKNTVSQHLEKVY